MTRLRSGQRIAVLTFAIDRHASSRTTSVESPGDAAYLSAESPVAPDGLIARSVPLKRRDQGEAQTLGVSPDHCPLFDK